MNNVQVAVFRHQFNTLLSFHYHKKFMDIYLAGYGRGGGDISEEAFAYFKSHYNNLFSFDNPKRMEIYFAGCECPQYMEVIRELQAKGLYSYYEIGGTTRFDTKKVFLDSGAFSAATRGVSIDIHEYADFIFKHLSKLTVYANLDVIGDHDASMKNLRVLEGKGLRPLPVFHYGSDLAALRELVEEYDYIALGGLVPLAMNRPKLVGHLNRCFNVIRDKCRVHLFGITHPDILKAFPAYSADSTSWLMGTKFGKTYQFDGGLRYKVHQPSKGKPTDLKTFMLMDKKNEGKQWMQRILHNAEEMARFEQFLTELWAQRGVVFTD